ncbi:MAG: hypothetical protein IKH48_01485 [Prevotella sp.]|nr:hypothetical protein [Prevotella sp.]MBR7086233.1 hypothetical protein [Prevotella sp.]
MTKQEALKQFAELGAVWFGNSKQHFAFSAYCRMQGWNKLAGGAVPELHREAGLQEFPYGNDVMV